MSLPDNAENEKAYADTRLMAPSAPARVAGIAIAASVADTIALRFNMAGPPDHPCRSYAGSGAAAAQERVMRDGWGAAVLLCMGLFFDFCGVHHWPPLAAGRCRDFGARFSAQADDEIGAFAGLALVDALVRADDRAAGGEHLVDL